MVNQFSVFNISLINMKQCRSGRSKHWMHMEKKEEMERKARASCLSLTPVKCIVYPWDKTELHQLLFISPALLSSYIPNPLNVKRLKTIRTFSDMTLLFVWKNSTRYPPRLVQIKGIQRNFSSLISFFLSLFSSEPSAGEGWGIQCQALHLWQSLTMTISPRERK